ncbi:MAG: GntR family transcriptional regulator [Spirochaetales bacterium]|nr:GntR family transcriptional regulator [Spirochaetales bacterium]
MQFKQGLPIYRQIADHMSEQILLGHWEDGERIPSVRELAVNLEVNPNTVIRAYGYLQEEEVIYNKRGIGYFAAEQAADKIRGIKRKEFVVLRLPEIFKTLELLGIDMDELGKLFQNYKLRKEAS